MLGAAVGVLFLTDLAVGALVFVAVVFKSLVVAAAFLEELVSAVSDTLVRNVDISSSTLTAFTIGAKVSGEYFRVRTRGNVEVAAGVGTYNEMGTIVGAAVTMSVP